MQGVMKSQYPIAWGMGVEGQGAVHLLHRSMSSVLQNICHPHRESRSPYWVALERRTQTHLQRTSSHLCLPTALLEREGHCLLGPDSRPLRRCALLTLLNANLRRVPPHPPLPHELEVLQGMWGTSYLGDSYHLPSQVVLSLYQNCPDLLGATLSMSLLSPLAEDLS